MITASVHDRDHLGRSALHCAVEFDADPEVIELLVENGCDLEEPMPDGRTILEVACSNGVECVSTLIRLGVDVNQRNSLGETPLHRCAGSARTNVARALLAGGADRTLKTPDGLAAVDLARNIYMRSVLRLE